MPASYERYGLPLRAIAGQKIAGLKRAAGALMNAR
jgi:hypothetical protein